MMVLSVMSLLRVFSTNDDNQGEQAINVFFLKLHFNALFKSIPYSKSKNI